MDLTWLAEIVFFGSYFITWITDEIPHVTWINITAVAALVIAVLMLVWNSRPYWDGNHAPRA